MKDLLAAGAFLGVLLYVRMVLKGFDELAEGLGAWLVNQKRAAEHGSQSGDER